MFYERELYRNAFSNGMGVIEFAKPNDNALKDFEGFYSEIVGLCGLKKHSKKAEKGA